MDAISYTDLRINLARTMDKVCDDHMPVVVTRQRSRSVVMMSLEDYHGIEETLYLMRNPANAARLRDSIKNVQAGNVLFVDKLPE